MDKRQLTEEEWVALVKLVALDMAKLWLRRGVKIGFLGGLTVGWIAGGMVMLYLS